MNEEADRRVRIKDAIQEFMTNQMKQGKRGKRKTFKLFSLDRDDPREKQAGDFMTSKGG